MGWVSDTQVARERVDRWLADHFRLTAAQEADLSELIDDYGDACRQAGQDAGRPD